MRASKLPAALAAAVALVAIGGVAVAADPAAIVKERQDTMKRQGADLKEIKAFLDGKADDLAAVQKHASDLTQTTGKIPSLFPPGSDMAPPGGKFRPKPDVWSNWTDFLTARKAAGDKAEALLAAANTGDKAKIQAAFSDLGKNGCGACHDKFREKLQ